LESWGIDPPKYPSKKHTRENLRIIPGKIAIDQAFCFFGGKNLRGKGWTKIEPFLTFQAL